MTTDDPRVLISGYAAEVLTSAEKHCLLTAALRVPEIFDELYAEERWRRIYNALEIRPQVIEALDSSLAEASDQEVTSRSPVTDASITVEGQSTQSPSDYIDSLYSKLRSLEERVAKEPDLEKEIAELLTELRHCQEKEAAVMRKRFEAGLHLPPGSGWSALENARRLLKISEDPASEDATTSDCD